MMEQLKLLGERLRDQDTRMTSHPVFLVQTRKRTYGVDPREVDDAACAWIHRNSVGGFTEATEVEGAILDSIEKAKHWNQELTAELRDFWAMDEREWDWTGFIDTWEYEAACFTQAAADAYIATHKHNLSEARVYVDSGFRNEEWKLIRKFLLSLVEPPKEH